MKYIILILLSLLSRGGYANSTTDINVVVRSQEVTVTSGGETLTYDPSSGILTLTDGYEAFDGFDIRSVGNQQGHQVRDYSLFTINMIGQKRGEKFSIKSKFASSQINIGLMPTAAGWDETFSNQGCSRVLPRSDTISYTEIASDRNVNSECKGKSRQKSYPHSNIMLVYGDYRNVIFDIGSILKSQAYQSLPADIYKGTTVYNGDKWQARVGGHYAPSQIFNFTLEKKPYFSGIAISNNQVTFNVQNINESSGFSVLGNASVNFNLLGMFSDSDKIKIDVASTNNYRLTSAGGSVIPYSVDLEYRGTRSPLVLQGNKQPAVVIAPGVMGSAVNGQLKFDFKTPASQVHNGLFSDNLTLIAELVL